MTKTAGEHQGSRPARALRAVLVHGAGMILALALLPLCLVGLPFAAWAVAAGLVLANRVVHGIVFWSVRDSSLTVALGAMGFSMIFRALLTALALFFVGAAVGSGGDRPIGFDRPDLARPAVILFLLCFTLDAGIEAIRRAGERDELVAADAANAASATIRETPA
jgi:hypothetical protein